MNKTQISYKILIKLKFETLHMYLYKQHTVHANRYTGCFKIPAPHIKN